MAVRRSSIVDNVLSDWDDATANADATSILSNWDDDAPSSVPAVQPNEGRKPRKRRSGKASPHGRRDDTAMEPGVDADREGNVPDIVIVPASPDDGIDADDGHMHSHDGDGDIGVESRDVSIEEVDDTDIADGVQDGYDVHDGGIIVGGVDEFAGEGLPNDGEGEFDGSSSILDDDDNDDGDGGRGTFDDSFDATDGLITDEPTGGIRIPFDGGVLGDEEDLLSEDDDSDTHNPYPSPVSTGISVPQAGSGDGTTHTPSPAMTVDTTNNHPVTRPHDVLEGFLDMYEDEMDAVKVLQKKNMEESPFGKVLLAKQHNDKLYRQASMSQPVMGNTQYGNDASPQSVDEPMSGNNSAGWGTMDDDNAGVVSASDSTDDDVMSQYDGDGRGYRDDDAVQEPGNGVIDDNGLTQDDDTGLHLDTGIHDDDHDATMAEGRDSASWGGDRGFGMDAVDNGPVAWDNGSSTGWNDGLTDGDNDGGQSVDDIRQALFDSIQSEDYDDRLDIPDVDGGIHDDHDANDVEADGDASVPGGEPDDGSDVSDDEHGSPDTESNNGGGDAKGFMEGLVKSKGSFRDKLGSFMSQVKSELHGGGSPEDSQPERGKSVPSPKDKRSKDMGIDDNNDAHDAQRMGFKQLLALVRQPKRLLSTVAVAVRGVKKATWVIIALVLVIGAVWGSSNIPAIMDKGGVDGTAVDEGSVTLEGAAWRDGMAVVTLGNPSDMVAHVSGTAEVRSWAPTINPMTWLGARVTAHCTIPGVEVNPGEEKTVESTCSEASGVWHRVRVQLQYD